jgi:DNA primase
MRIPDEKIDEVRNGVDIVDVIGATVRLRKRGRSYVGLCPFHGEKTPSFTVSADKQMFHCFGCGKGGNVFTFVMERDKMSFIEAVRFLADRAGVRLPSEGSDSHEGDSEQDQLFEICRAAGLHYQDNLLNHSEGKLALEYLRHRGFTDQTIRKFGLGYSLNSWDDLLQFTRREKLDPALVERAGLLVRREDNSGVYDRFRGRAMFPILSATGRTIAFGARKLREDDPLGKYINSPETPIYNKSRVLYGLFQAKEAIREKEFVIMVEGYADLITVAQAGIENIVASSGTALTEEQIQLVKRYARNVTLVYDADSAGSKATLRGGDLIIERDLDVKVAELPAGEDPDSFVKKNGGKEFSTLLENAESFVDFRGRQLHASGSFATPEGKTQAIRSLVETIARYPDELKRTFYLKRIAKEYDVYESVLLREIDRIFGRQTQQQRFTRKPEPEAKPAPAVTAAPPRSSAPPPAAERELLRLVLEHKGAMLRYIFSRIDKDVLTSPVIRDVIGVVDMHEEGGETWDPGTLVNELQDDDARKLVSMLILPQHELSKAWKEMGTEPPPPDPYAIADDCITRLHMQQLDDRIAEVYKGMKDAELRGESITALQEEILDLQRQKKELRKPASPGF